MVYRAKCYDNVWYIWKPDQLQLAKLAYTFQENFISKWRFYVTEGYTQGRNYASPHKNISDSEVEII